MVEAILLGLVQGLTEFLPVSSSGHLVLAQALLPQFERTEIVFEVCLHAATVGAVVVCFRRELMRMLLSLRAGGDSSDRRLVYAVVAASLPTAAIGFLFRDFFHSLFQSPDSAAAMLIVTGALLWLSETLAKPSEGIERIGLPRSFVVGVVQGISIIPGISRSGSTIAAAMFMGIKPADAAKFSFLASVPAVFGAMLLEASSATAVAASLWPSYLAGMVAAFFSGLWAIGFLMKVLKKGKFRWFALYCWTVGLGYLLLG